MKLGNSEIMNIKKDIITSKCGKNYISQIDSCALYTCTYFFCMNEGQLKEVLE